MQFVFVHFILFDYFSVNLQNIAWTHRVFLHRANNMCCCSFFYAFISHYTSHSISKSINGAIVILVVYYTRFNAVNFYLQMISMVITCSHSCSFYFIFTMSCVFIFIANTAQNNKLSLWHNLNGSNSSTCSMPIAKKNDQWRQK